MISTLDRIESLGNSSLGVIEEQRDFVRDSLEVLRATSQISNDAFLDAGTIQGGLSLLLNLISQGISEDEAFSQLEGLKLGLTYSRRNTQGWIRKSKVYGNNTEILLK